MNLSQHKSTKVSLLILLVLVIAVAGLVYMKRETLLPLFMQKLHHTQNIKLPAPVFSSNTSVEAAIKQRRSTREYKPDALTLAEVSQLLWAAQGITATQGFRSA